MNQITLEEKPTHRLWAEVVHGVAFLHLDVLKWNAKVLRQMDARWKEICGSVRGSVYVCQSNMPTDRFLKRFGFVPDKNVNDMKIWRRDF